MEQQEIASGLIGALDSFFAQLEKFDQFFVYFQYVSIAFGILIVIEIAWDFLSGNRRKFWEPLANLSFYVVTSLLQRTIYGLVVIAGFAYIEQFALFDIPITPLTWVICLLGADLTYYWMHRIEHRVRFFWALHSVHHSSEEYDLTTSMRIFWLIDVTIVFFFVPMVLIGFSGPQVLVCMLIVFTYMIWVHTEKIGKLGWFDKIFSSPSVHRVHHGSNPQYLDKNYAGILVIWDRIFGTYEPEIEKVRYGLVTPIDTSNPVRIGFHELIELGRDLKNRKGFRNRLLTMIKPPDWSPEATK